MFSLKSCQNATIVALAMLALQAAPALAQWGIAPTPVPAGDPLPESKVEPARPAELLQGIQLFNNKDYAAAIVHFDNVLKVHPKNQSVHYYKALSLQYINDIPGAKKEYALAATGKDAKVKELADQALAGLNKKKTSAATKPGAKLSANASAKTSSTSKEPEALKAATGKEPEALKPAAVAAAKPSVVFFFVESDLASRELMPIFLDLKRQYKQSCDLKYLNADEMANKKLVEKYEVENCPTFIFIDVDGKEKERMVTIPEDEVAKEAIASRIKKLINK